jgi:hypothetical protein
MKLEKIVSTLSAHISNAKSLEDCLAKASLSASAVSQKLSGGSAVEVRKLKLRTYDGNIKNWREWYDQMKTAAIIENDSIPRPRDKLMHLQNCVVEKAREALMGLEATDENVHSILSSVVREIIKTNIINVYRRF